MSENLHTAPPERLREDAELGPLIDGSNRDFARGLDEAAAFQRLAERLERSKERPRSHRVAWGAALGVAAVIALASAPLLRQSNDHVTLSPEVGRTETRAVSEPVAPELVPTVEPQAPGEAEGALAARNTDAARLAKAREISAARLPEKLTETPAPSPLETPADAARAEPRRDLDAPAPARLGDDRPAPDVKPPRSKPAPEKTRAHATPQSASRQLARGAAMPAQPRPNATATEATRINCLEEAGRDARAAELCFAQRATGAGLSAEMALYEMARLRRDVLRDALGALNALNDYRQRFPLGSLRHEVDITRIELLGQLGRSREALRESEALLFSPSGRERAAELHMLRGNVFRHDLSDQAAAALEYSLAEPFGGTLGAEASRLRGQSLEALGDLPGALAAYRRYLASSAPSARRNEVARRVEQLSARTAPRK